MKYHASVAEATDAGAFGPDLIQRIAGGEKNALAALYDQTSRMIYGLVMRVVLDPEAAEQVTLDVYMQVWRTASSYTPGRGSVTGWLAVIARAKALEWLHLREARSAREERRADPYLEVE